MIIILEGPDGTGKSTLAKHIASTKHFEWIHMGIPQADTPPNAMFNEYLDLVGFNIGGKSKNIILDRSWYSEMAYGPIKRGTSLISSKECQLLEMHLWNRAFVIYCTTDPLKSYENAKKRGESYITDYETHLAIHNAYESLFVKEKITLPIVRYNYEQDSHMSILRQAVPYTS